jgi:PTS system nitrogen regulatory IIA component
MDIRDFLSPDDTALDVPAPDKARLLRELARRAAARLGLDRDAVAAQILKREELGSTGVGKGVALPHARIEGLRKPFGMLVRLKMPLAFEAIDERPVDIVFLLLAPPEEGSQLNALAGVARRLRDDETLRAVRQARTAAALYEAIAGE